MKKFKINRDTTLDEIDKELDSLYRSALTELELNEIIKIAEFLDCEYLGHTKGSAVRFKHTCISSFGNFFTVHLIHGKKVDLIRIRDFKQYIYPNLKQIVQFKKKP